MGPGVATFLCGAESFPTPIRGHFLGLAAAVGKAGAAIGTQVSMKSLPPTMTVADSVPRSSRRSRTRSGASFRECKQYSLLEQPLLRQEA